MRSRIVFRLLCLVLLLMTARATAAAEELTDALHAYLQQYVRTQVPNACLVIGIVDERGSRVVACGKLDNGTAQQANGDTIFEIGSVTKTSLGCSCRT